MRRADPRELAVPALPVVTARLTEAELSKWLPIRFDAIDDPLQVPEPSLAALAELDSGGFVVLTYGKDSNQLTVELPQATKSFSSLLAAFFREAPIPASRVLWHRRGTRLPKRVRLRPLPVATAARKEGSVASSTTERKKRSAFRAAAPAKRK
jgi:hypothetical protein